MSNSSKIILFSGSDNWRSPNTNTNNFNQSDNSKVTMQVPSSDVGKLIGKQGVKIKMLQEKSGARINVSC